MSEDRPQRIEGYGLQAFGVTEPTDTTSTRHDAAQNDGGLRADVTDTSSHGQKVWASRAEHSDLMLLVARTTPIVAGEQDRPKAVSVFSDVRPAFIQAVGPRGWQADRSAPSARSMNHDNHGSLLIDGISRCRLENRIARSRAGGYGYTDRWLERREAGS